LGGGLQLEARARELARALLDGFKRHDLLTYASAISFQILTAIIPFALFVLAAAGLLHELSPHDNRPCAHRLENDHRQRRSAMMALCPI
jgi:uncharacterized BrkB/YihY/UPF0761 family membrane protein